MERSNTRNTTVSDVAKHAGVSATTVSLALNGQGARYRIPEETIARVMRSARSLHYKPNAAARQLTGMRSNVLGVLVISPGTADPRLLFSMEQAAARRNFRIIIGHAVGQREHVREYLADFKARGVDAVVPIFHTHPEYNTYIHEQLAAFDNVIYYDQPCGPNAPAQACSIEPDYTEVGRVTVQHLLSLGRRRIALLLSNLKMPYAQARHRAYWDTLQQAGVESDPRLVWLKTREGHKQDYDPFTQADAEKFVQDVILTRKADGVVCVNDTYAARIILAMRRMNIRVPQDVAVVGCDDMELSTMVDPNITSVNQRLEELGELAVATAEKIIHHEWKADRPATVLPPQLVIRESCGGDPNPSEPRSSPPSKPKDQAS